MKFNDGVYRKVTGASAKHFRSNDVVQAYPLFKTHKLEPKDLQAARAENIPVRVLQSAESITTSRVSAFLEHLLKPISSVLCCSAQPVEYCQDSRQYISDLLMWQTKKLMRFRTSLVNPRCLLWRQTWRANPQTQKRYWATHSPSSTWKTFQDCCRRPGGHITTKQRLSE